jgi:hypothetical protein
MVTVPKVLSMDQLQYHLISESEMTQETGWKIERMKQVAWCFTYVKVTTLTENYKAGYE